MNKRKLLSMLGILTLSLSSVLMATPVNDQVSDIPGVESISKEGRALSCHPGYITTTGNSSPGSHGSHTFTCSGIHGSNIKETCNTIYFYQTIRYSCSKCGASSTEDTSYTTHNNSHCPSH